MKHFILIFHFFTSLIFSQHLEISGTILDGKTKLPLSSANVFLQNYKIGVASDIDGKFKILSQYDENDSLIISYIGYETQKISLKDFNKSDKTIELAWVDYKLQSVVVSAIISDEKKSPISFSKIKKKEIEENYSVQDVPEYLSYLPSTTFYSESGNGIGYNYLSIRGFDQRRISVSVNGIPQNDPEDHNIYWLDLPDLLESTELIQVQRGAGAGSIGYPSIGGSINIITSPFSDKPNFELSLSGGSYNTKKYSAKFASGLIENKYSIYAKLSKIMSSGYRDKSWVDFNSYHIAAARYDKNITTQINFFGGPISDGLAYTGLPKFAIKNKELRKENLSYWEADKNSYTYKVERKSSEIENFSQPHFELLNEFQISNNLTLSNALFLVMGEGFFDYDGSWSIYYDDYFRLKQNGFDSTFAPQNAIIHAVVKNKQWGIIPRLTWEHNNGKLVSGLEYRNHKSKHWGNIRFAENIPANVSQNYQYYYYEGGKDIVNFFLNENYNFTENFNLMAEIQLSFHEYKLLNEKYLDYSISINDLYLNPRFGVNYKFNNQINSYLSFAKVTREPRLKNYYDSAESSAGETPQFELNKFGNFDFKKPLVKPEIMTNLELGARFSKSNLGINLNLFLMLFKDEIVSQGQLDRFGQPITGNVDKTIHSGIEIEGFFKINSIYEIIFNSTFSKNYISDGSTFVNTFDEFGNSITKQIDLKENSIPGFPNLISNVIFKVNFENLNFQIISKYVGKYYSDFYDENLSNLIHENPGIVTYNSNEVDQYFVMNILGSYNFQIKSFLSSAKLFFQLNNAFDNLYAAYATGGDFFPAAERNILVGIKLGL
ncbi:MAG: TonB-dependent receptor [Ignavibacteriae bacterium]|nr:TonB-dependent receptor [Ignavibacteriota bacterium]